MFSSAAQSYAQRSLRFPVERGDENRQGAPNTLRPVTQDKTMSLTRHTAWGDRRWAKDDRNYKKEHHPSTYSTGDGTDALFSGGSRYLSWETISFICRSEKLLLAEQEDENNIHLGSYKFPKRTVTQVSRWVCTQHEFETPSQLKYPVRRSLLVGSVPRGPGPVLDFLCRAD